MLWRVSQTAVRMQIALQLLVTGLALVPDVHDLFGRTDARLDCDLTDIFVFDLNGRGDVLVSQLLFSF